MVDPKSLFADPANFEAALVHRSYCNEHPGLSSNERLEFLGDSVLSLIISDRLYRLFPQTPEGELTARRSNLVQTVSLAQKSRDLGLDKVLLLSRGEEDMGGRNNNGLLANTFEAVLGALYLDSGIEVCRKYLEEIFSEEEILAVRQIKDPKSLLQEYSQAKGLGTPVYSVVESKGPDHAKSFTVAVVLSGKEVGRGPGSSKQRAETAAAANTLMQIAPELLQ